MAKKKQPKQRKERHYDVVNLCACIALFITAFLFLTRWIVSLFNFAALNSIVSVLDLIAQIALLVAIAFPAYRHVRGCTNNRRAWKTCYWIALVVYILVVFLGFGFGIAGFKF